MNSLTRWKQIEKDFRRQGYRRHVETRDLVTVLSTERPCPTRCGQHLHIRGFKKGGRYEVFLVCPNCGEVRRFDTMEPVV